MKSDLLCLIIAAIAVIVFGCAWFAKTTNHISEAFVDATYTVKIGNSVHSLGGVDKFRKNLGTILAKSAFTDIQQLYRTAIGIGYKVRRGDAVSPSDIVTIAKVDLFNPGFHIRDISGNSMLRTAVPTTEPMVVSTAAPAMAETIRVNTGATIQLYGYKQFIATTTKQAKILFRPADYIYIQSKNLLDTIAASTSPITLAKEDIQRLAMADYMTGSGFATRNAYITAYLSESVKNQKYVATERLKNVPAPVTQTGPTTQTTTKCPDLSAYIPKSEVVANYLPKSAVQRDYLPLLNVEREYVKRNEIPCWGCTL